MIVLQGQTGAEGRPHWIPGVTGRTGFLFVALIILCTYAAAQSSSNSGQSQLKTSSRQAPAGPPHSKSGTRSDINPYEPTPAEEKRLSKALDRASKDVKTIQDSINTATEATQGMAGPETADDAAIATMNAITKTLKEFQKSDPRPVLASAESTLNADIHELDLAYRPFSAFRQYLLSLHLENPKPAMQRLLDRAEDLNDKVNASRDALDSAKTDGKAAHEALEKALTDLGPSVEAVAKKLFKSLQSLSDAPHSAPGAPLPLAEAPRLRAILAKDFQNLTTALHVRRQFGPAYTALYTAAGALDDPKPCQTPPADVVKTLDPRLKEIRSRVEEWITLLAKESDEVDAQADALLTAYIKEPGRHETEVRTALSVDGDIHRDLDAFLPKLQALVDELQSTALPPLPAATIPDGFQIDQWLVPQTLLTRSNTRQGVLLTLLSQPPTADVSTWVSEPISLYYFDDVPRLMQVLSDTAAMKGGSAELQDKAREARTALEQAAGTLVAARQATSDARRELEIKREALRVGKIEAERKSATAEREARTARSQARQDMARLRELERQQALADSDHTLAVTDDGRKKMAFDQAKADYTAAQMAADAAPTDMDKARTAKEAKVKLDRAQRAHDAAVQRVDATQRRLDRATADADLIRKQGTADATDATTAETDAKQKLTDIETQLTDLQGKMTAAEADEKAKTGDVLAKFTAARLAALADNAAFARARDNVPFWYSAPAPSATTDPVKKIHIYGFPDSKQLFLRGAQADVDLVREMIQKFDRPQASALMTLWKMEINSTSTPYGKNRADKALKALEEELAIARVQSNEAIAVLREVINQVVDEATLVYLSDHTSRITFGPEIDLQEVVTAKTQLQSSSEAQRPAKIAELSRKMRDALTGLREKLRTKLITQQENLKNATPDKRGEQLLQVYQAQHAVEYVAYLLTADDARAAGFYDPEVLARLGWSDIYAENAWDTSHFRAVIPDPKGTTTLAEALVVLSLAKRDYQRRILDLFLPRVNDRIRKYTLSVVRTVSGQKGSHANELLAMIEATQAARDTASETLTNAQKEYADALATHDQNSINTKKAAVQTAASTLDKLEVELDKATQLSAATRSATDIRTHFTNLRRFIGEDIEPGAGIKSFQREIVDELRRNAVAPIREYLVFLNERHRVLTPSFKKATSAGSQPNATLQDMLIYGEYQDLETKIRIVAGWLYTFLGYSATADIDRILFMNPDEIRAEFMGLQKLSPFKLANARQAALNEMLKEYSQSVDEDIQEQFIQPMFERIRARMLGAGVQVGVVQRTQILASNRLVARVDPSASAQLAVAQETNVLQAVNQIAQIALAVQSGGISTSLGGLEKLTSAQGALEKLPRDAPPGVYGVTTGDVFQVTPITDPTGQALRFRFDHLSSTQISEPSGLTNPQLPRIDRHGINTEVQLSNHEIRTLSRFDTNVKLGVPERRSGGLPIFKDIPYIRDIPLIGWFTRTAGQASTIQQSIILGQTEMFPTVTDIIDLLTRPISRQSPWGISTE